MIDAEIRDQAYQFFVEEAPELLQIIEAGILSLIQERTPAQVHELMRAAHSIKGGAASVGLDEIQFLAHRLEDIFKALYSEALTIDTELENLLLKAYDCLYSPLMEQVTTGKFDSESALATANHAFAQVEERLGDCLTQMDSYIPSTSDLGVDMVSSLFEVDVAQGLERLAAIVATPQAYEVAGELRALSEVFVGFAEMLNLPGFGEIAQTVLAALDAAPDRLSEIATLALGDFEDAKAAVLAGDRTQGGSPSKALLALSQSAQTPPLEALFFEAEDNGAVELDPPLDFAIDPASILADDHKQNGHGEGAFPHLSHPSSGTGDRDDFIDAQILTPNAPAPSPESDSGSSNESGSLVLLPQSPSRSSQEAHPAKLSVRVDLDRLERMNNLIGELVINRNSLSLQNEQLQATVRELMRRFDRFETLTEQLRDLSDKLLVEPMSFQTAPFDARLSPKKPEAFDALEMDSYGTIHSLLQSLVEDIMQLREAADDIALFAKQSEKTIGQQRQNLAQVRDELMQARMLPLSEVVQRFPRIVRKLATEGHKPVNLKMSGTDVLVDKGLLEKLYDPLLHLLRNAFAHGIEPPEVRQQQRKPAQGRIEVRAYRRGNQTLIEIEDDGQGINFEKIARRAIAMGWLSPEQLAQMSQERLLDFIFKPGFSTASQVSELSGRGVGLDVVQDQLRALKGSISIASSPGKGTTFTLRLPLTLTVDQLLICSAGAATLAIPTNSIEEIVMPTAAQTTQDERQRYFHWREQMIPVYRLANLLDYRCPLGNSSLVSIPLPESSMCPVLVLRGEQQLFALEIERLGPEQELVIKPFGDAIAPPSYVCGCTVLGDGTLVPVIDAAALTKAEGLSRREFLREDDLSQGDAYGSSLLGALASFEGTSKAVAPLPVSPSPSPVPSLPLPFSVAAKTEASLAGAVSTVLVIDDSTTIRQSLVLTLQKAGYRVLQARNGWEAIEQLRHSTDIHLAICDVEMPKMNGFELLSQLRREPQSQVPVVMLTSRGSVKHRQLATYLGATAYFTKPYLEHEFLAAIRNIIDENTPLDVSARRQA